MTDKNQEAFEQMKRLTKQAKKFYGSNYNPGTLYPPRDTKFLLDEEYIPFDFDTDYDDPLYKEYRRVRMLDNPFEDNQTQAQNLALKQELKGFDQDDDTNQTNSANFSFSKSWPSSFAQADNNVDYSKYGEDFSKEFIDEMLADTEYQQALKEYAIPNEGGYVNNQNDPGGETNMGISKRYHPHEDIKNLTRERANAILYKEIWKWNGINRLPREIKGFVFDHGIRTSPQNAIETTHRSLDINPVGDIIGNVTLNRLKNTDYKKFLLNYQNLVKKQDRNNANYQYFGTGWDNRTDGYHISY